MTIFLTLLIAASCATATAIAFTNPHQKNRRKARQSSMQEELDLDERAEAFVSEVSKYDRMLKADEKLRFIISLARPMPQTTDYFLGTSENKVVSTKEKGRAKRFLSAEQLILSYEALRVAGEHPSILMFKEGEA